MGLAYTVPMTLAELPTEELDGMMEDFIPQTQPDMCYSTGLVNVINEFGAREDHAPMKYSLGQMNKICGYREGRHCQDNMVPRWVSEELQPYGYKLMQEQGKDADRVFLTTVVEDPRRSFPLVNVSPDYFDHVGIRHRGAYQWDHVIVIMGINHEVVYFYDPYKTFYCRAPSVMKIPKHMPIPVFLELWEGAYERRWMCWIEPLTTVQTTLPRRE